MSVVIDLKDRVVLVTGGARGVGAGITQAFLDAGAVVEICGRSLPEAGGISEHPSVHFTQVDVRNAEQVQDWVSEVHSRRGRIDVAVNNAGGSPFGRFEKGSARYLQAITELNFLSAAHVASAVLPVMMRQPEKGSVVNITSISARRPSPGTAVYGAAKAALESLTGSLAVEWAPHIRVNAVSCGLVATEGAVDHYGDEESFERVAATIPRGQFAAPSEIGAACVMLASDMASHITGAVLDVDGGGEWPAFLAHTPNADELKPLELEVEGAL
ncbi:NAD(P)-dependent dehydrogenase (short-subunit alcohol dehydrogenase family) [Arthrobacter sp. AG1021]|uniref:SDR family oxidoreductase n=1 Tax=Arthrobacter sp. AG1021 TaxID=2183908 RepID=UPI000EAE03CE|nr:SDR family oxidoreductase [Arthrobacter sp. AG1021]RKS16270.1 NAD(P)-dependent dehydrogenase (short-subunit alcohol dehydrogenase family) [Arthrobacter sp. AG1021]